jgi:hypothetical protein
MIYFFTYTKPHVEHEYKMDIGEIVDSFIPIVVDMNFT